MNLEQLIQLCDRITRMHTGKDLQTVMATDTCDRERGMLHLLLEALDYGDPNNGYRAVARAFAADGYKCHGSISSAFAYGLRCYANDGRFKMEFHQLAYSLRDARAH
jgi:hypothetical protein